MQATPIKVDISTGMKTVTLLVADLSPFQNLGKPVELTVSTFNEAEPKPENLVTLDTQAQPPGKPSEVVTGVEPFAERPVTSSGAMGAANADNPNACPLCYGHGLVREFRGENDITGTTAVCKECSGTGIKPAAPAIAQDTSAIKTCTVCSGTGCNGTPGQNCEHCSGTGTEPV